MSGKGVREAMHLGLAQAGIFLEDANLKRAKAIEEDRRSRSIEVDRDEVRRILSTARRPDRRRIVPDRDLEWMVASCPSVTAALDYVAARSTE